MESRSMMRFNEERIDLPKGERFMPTLEGLKWHREKLVNRYKLLLSDRCYSSHNHPNSDHRININEYNRKNKVIQLQKV